MTMESISSFFSMGGHGLFIWSAYGITLIVLSINVWLPRLTRSKFIRIEKAALKRNAMRGSE